MKIYTKYKIALAFRRLYSGLCPRCKQSMIAHTKSGKLKGLTNEEIGKAAQSFICEKCTTHLEETMAEINKSL